MLKLVPKLNLSTSLVDIINDEVRKECHKYDSGPKNNWFTDSCAEHLLVIVINDKQPIGIIYYGGNKDVIDVGWWISSLYRNKGYGTKAIDELATFLKDSGITGVGRISIDIYRSEYNVPSCKLVKRLKKNFT